MSIRVFLLRPHIWDLLTSILSRLAPSFLRCKAGVSVYIAFDFDFDLGSCKYLKHASSAFIPQNTEKKIEAPTRADFTRIYVCLF